MAEATSQNPVPKEHTAQAKETGAGGHKVQLPGGLSPLRLHSSTSYGMLGRMSCKGDGEAAVSGLENNQEFWGPWKFSEKLVENKLSSGVFSMNRDIQKLFIF